MHDLVRDFMISKAEAAYEGGLRAMQRAALPLLLSAFDANDNEAASRYVASSLHWHVREAQQPNVAVPTDTLIMRVLTHSSSGDIRRWFPSSNSLLPQSERGGVATSKDDFICAFLDF